MYLRIILKQLLARTKTNEEAHWKQIINQILLHASFSIYTWCSPFRLPSASQELGTPRPLVLRCPGAIESLADRRNFGSQPQSCQVFRLRWGRSSSLGIPSAHLTIASLAIPPTPFVGLQQLHKLFMSA